MPQRFIKFRNRKSALRKWCPQGQCLLSICQRSTCWRSVRSYIIHFQLWFSSRDTDTKYKWVVPGSCMNSVLTTKGRGVRCCFQQLPSFQSQHLRPYSESCLVRMPVHSVGRVPCHKGMWKDPSRLVICDATGPGTLERTLAPYRLLELGQGAVLRTFQEAFLFIKCKMSPPSDSEPFFFLFP